MMKDKQIVADAIALLSDYARAMGIEQGPITNPGTWDRDERVVNWLRGMIDLPPIKYDQMGRPTG